MTVPRLCNARWELGSAGHVYIQWPEPLPVEELDELDQLLELWLEGVKRRARAVHMATGVERVWVRGER